MVSPWRGDFEPGWISDSIKLRLEFDPPLEDRFGEHEDEARREFVAKAVQENIERDENSGEK